MQKSSSPSRLRKTPAFKARRFGRYILLHKLASGGMGDIFLARQHGPAGFTRMVVIKKILEHLSQEAMFVDMFLDEARIAAGLNHPNIVQIYDMGEVEGQFFIAMEYLSGQSLAKILRRLTKQNERLPLPIAETLMAAACAGLDFAHKKTDVDGSPLNIVHRDVSPQNLFVTFDGVVKVVDFGIAKATSKVTQTKTGQLKGKYAYMSPEQGLGRDLDHRSDVFSLGIILFELVTGKRLFKTESELLTLKKITEMPIPPPASMNPNVDEGLTAILLKALSRDRSQRFQSAGEMEAALHNHLREKGTAPTTQEIGLWVRESFADELRAQQEMVERCTSGNLADLEPVEEEGSYAPMPGGVSTAHRQGFSFSQAALVSIILLLAGLAALGVWYMVRQSSPPSAALFVETDPEGARVFLDGEGPLCDSPCEVQQALLSGPHVVRLEKEGHLPWEATIIAKEGAETKGVQARLQQKETAAPGRLLVYSSPPGAKVFLDGKAMDIQTPATLGTVEPHVPHLIRLLLEGYGDSTTRVQLAPGEAKEVLIHLSALEPKREASPKVAQGPSENTKARPAKGAERKPSRPKSPEKNQPPPEETGFGFLTLDSQPWATVYYKGRRLGQTPLIKYRMAAGTHSLTLDQEDKGQKHGVTVKISPDQATVKRLKF